MPSILKTIIIVLACTCHFACAQHQVTVNLQVVDDQQNPVSDVKVGMGFLMGQGDNSAHGYTDAEGKFSATEEAILGVSILLNKKGYYTSQTRTGYGDQDVTMVLRPIKNPVPMYYKKVRLILPAKGRRFGFDLEKADWVAPHGKGLTAHIYFNVDGERQDINNYDQQMEVTFANEHDGIVKLGHEGKVVESNYQFPYKAPVNDYVNKLMHKNKRSLITKGYSTKTIADTTYDKSILGYVFRVNTEVDKGGNVINANYGRLSGEFVSGVVSPDNKEGNAGKGFVRFNYYYNPVKNERSLEFDYNKNLFNTFSQ